MSTNAQQMLKALGELEMTTNILVAALIANDNDKAHEAISVLLMQGLDFFGTSHPVMQQFSPVWSAIKTHIDASNIPRALTQAGIWKAQLLEVIKIVTAQL